MVLISSNLVIWVRFYDRFTIKKSRLILLCRPSLGCTSTKLNADAERRAPSFTFGLYSCLQPLAEERRAFRSSQLPYGPGRASPGQDGAGLALDRMGDPHEKWTFAEKMCFWPILVISGPSRPQKWNRLEILRRIAPTRGLETKN